MRRIRKKPAVCKGSLWGPFPKDWQKKLNEVLPSRRSFCDKTVTLEQIREAVENGPEWPSPQITWKDMMVTLD